MVLSGSRCSLPASWYLQHILRVASPRFSTRYGLRASRQKRAEKNDKKLMHGIFGNGAMRFVLFCGFPSARFYPETAKQSHFSAFLHIRTVIWSESWTYVISNLLAFFTGRLKPLPCNYEFQSQQYTYRAPLASPNYDVYLSLIHI